MDNVQNNRIKASAVIVAAGSSSRMGLDKILAPLCNIPVIVHTILAFEKCDLINEIVVVVREKSVEDITKLVRHYSLNKVTHIIAGGKSRSRSVYNGICLTDENSTLIVVHDGARPLVDRKVIERAIAVADSYDVSTAAIAVKDTIKEVDINKIISTLNRDILVIVQTPQAFKRSLYMDLYDGEEYTDDCQLFEKNGYIVRTSFGDYANIKLTTPEDMVIAKALMEYKNDTHKQ